MKTELIKDAASAKEAVKVKERLWKIETDKLNKERSKISNEYYDKIRKLEDERSDKLYEIDKTIKKFEDDANIEFTELSKPIHELNKILSLMHIYNGEINEPSDLQLIPSNTRYGNEIYVEEIDTLLNDSYMNLRVYVFENRKPKNKYTLCIAGVSIFWDDKIIKYPYAYGCDLDFDKSTLKIQIKDAATKEDLIEWWNRNKTRAFWNSEEHAEVVKQYEWVKENCNTPEWQMAYLLKRKDYYERQVSHGVETPEYKAILKQIKNLSKEQEVQVSDTTKAE